MRRRKRRSTVQPYIILLAFIIPLNFIGISYAYWNNGLDIKNSVSTGSIEPLFCDDYTLDVIRGNGDLTISIEDETTMIVEGRVYTDYKAFINYCLKNEGNVPVKFFGQEKSSDSTVTDLTLPSGLIEPEECIPSGNGNPKLSIQADQEGIYNFEIELPFQQWNDKKEFFLDDSVSD